MSLSRVRLRRRDQVGDGLEPGLGRGDQDIRRHAEHDDGREIFGWVVGQMAVQHGAGTERGRTGDDGVAVRIGLGDVGETDDAAGAGLGLDHHGLAEDLRHLIEHDAADGVGGAAGGERTDHADRPGRIVVGRDGRRCHEHGGCDYAKPCAK